MLGDLCRSRLLRSLISNRCLCLFNTNGLSIYWCVACISGCLWLLPLALRLTITLPSPLCLWTVFWKIFCYFVAISDRSYGVLRLIYLPCPTKGAVLT